MSLVHLLRHKGFDCLHTSELPLGNKSSDEDLLFYADKDDRIIVTKDSDFLVSHLLTQQPHKLVLIKTGNISNKLLIELVENNWELLTEMISRSSLIEISKDNMIERD